MNSPSSYLQGEAYSTSVPPMLFTCYSASAGQWDSANHTTALGERLKVYTLQHDRASKVSCISEVTILKWY